MKSNPKIQAIVDWWADKLVSCKQSGLSEAERQDMRNDSYQMAETLMTMNKPRVTEEQIESFRAALTKSLTAKEPHHLGVDYGPDATLALALSAAGINGGVGTLPIKTHMYISDTDVKVSYGYGAPAVPIWSKR